MVSPVEFTKLGVKARFQKLGSLKYFLIFGLIFLVFAGIEMVRYEEYNRCVVTETTKFFGGDTTKPDYSETFRKYSKELKGNNNNSTTVPEDQVKELLDSLKELRQALVTIQEQAIEPCRSGYSYDVFRWFSWVNPIGIANAQMTIGGYPESEIRGIVIISIFVCMGIFFFLSTGALLFSKNAKVVAFAMDSVKTLLGFFIGVAMSFMGVR